MICQICHTNTVRWVGIMGGMLAGKADKMRAAAAVPHTQCSSCGNTDCQRTPEAELSEVCPTCENSGWECYGLGFGDPHHRTCQDCGNPESLPCP